MALADRLIQRPPRETSGSRSSNRFDYQKDWVVCLVLELHQDGRNYLVLCDYHEDVTVLDDETSPSTASYYQVKTKDGGNWSLSNLLAQRKGRDGIKLPSTLAKLYDNYVKDPVSTETLNFVSNAHYNFTLSTGLKSLSRTRILCADLDVGVIDRIRNQLSSECANKCCLPDEPHLVFEVSALSLQDHCGHAKGKVTEFLDSELPGKKHPTVPVYRALFDEVRRKTDCEAIPVTFEELRTLKGIDRSTVDAVLTALAANKDLDALWYEIRERLVHEDLGPLEVREIRTAWSKYEIDRMDAANDIVQRIRKKVVAGVQEAILQDRNVSLSRLMAQVQDRLTAEGVNYSLTIKKHYINAMILMEFYENNTLPEADTELEEETP